MKVCRKQRTKYSNQDETLVKGGGRGKRQEEGEREREEKKGIKEERKKGNCGGEYVCMYEKKKG
jgi:hypothetical protein